MSASQSIDPQLKQNIEDQLERLFSQLDDLETLKDELSAEEYEEQKKDTMAQLTEFQDSLKQMTAGSMTLQSEFDAARQAISAAISQAFQTPEVIRLFARKQPAALRRKLAEIDRDVKLGKIQFSTVPRAASPVAPSCPPAHSRPPAPRVQVSSQAAEILIALKKLGEPLEPKEEKFLAQHKTASMADFEAVKDGGTVGEAALKGVTK